MNSVGAGSNICITFEVRDCDDVLTAPTSMTFIVRRPNGVAYAVVPTAALPAGTYTVTIDTAPGLEGQWWYTITTTGPDTESDGSFLVTEPKAVMV